MPARYHFQRRADECVVSRVMPELTVYLGVVRRIGPVWVAYPCDYAQANHLYVNEHRSRASAVAALDSTYREALAAELDGFAIP